VQISLTKNANLELKDDGMVKLSNYSSAERKIPQEEDALKGGKDELQM